MVSLNECIAQCACEPLLICLQLKITSDLSFVILACDGLYDVMTDQDVVDFVQPRLESVKTPEELIDVAKALVNHAVSFFSIYGLFKVIEIRPENYSGLMIAY